MPDDTLYSFRSPVGTFWIAPQPGVPDRVWLGIDDQALGSYVSAMQAADNVYLHASGHDAWDSRPSSANDPTDLGEWERFAHEGS